MASFNCRGLVYIGAREYVAKHVPGGVDAISHNLPRELAEFWDQLFLANSMYDALPIVPISETAAMLANLSHGDFVRANAAWLAERDVRGVYKLLLNVLSAEAVALRLPKAAIRYFDFGEARSKMSAKRSCQAEQSGIPRGMAAWFSACVNGFVPTALTIAGARNPRVRLLSTKSDGQRDGVETVTLKFEFNWSDGRDEVTLVPPPKSNAPDK
jgi:hypothetical protein